MAVRIEPRGIEPEPGPAPGPAPPPTGGEEETGPISYPELPPEEEPSAPPPTPAPVALPSTPLNIPGTTAVPGGSPTSLAPHRTPGYARDRFAAGVAQGARGAPSLLSAPTPIIGGMGGGLESGGDGFSGDEGFSPQDDGDLLQMILQSLAQRQQGGGGGV